MRTYTSNVGRSGSTMSVTEADLAAYVDGALPPERRMEIEGFLACNPDLAARVMHALHQRRRGRRTRGTMTKSRTPWTQVARTIATGLACILLGWGVAEAVDDDGPFRDLSSTPEYVDEAVMSLRAARLRNEMRSQQESPTLDLDEIRDTMQLRLPALPHKWRVVDAQVFPSDDGPSLSLLIETSPGRTLGMFAVRADTRVNENVASVEHAGMNSAYWERNGTAYVLCGDAPPGEILSRATLLSRSALM